MASKLRLVEEWAKTLKKIVPIVENTEEANLLQKIMSELRGDIDYFKEELEILGKSIEKLQTEVNNVIFRQRAELTKRQRSNRRIVCKVVIQRFLPFWQPATCPWPSLQ